MVRAKPFTPRSDCARFGTEFGGDDTCFGLVRGPAIEIDYFSLRELEATESPDGLRKGCGPYFAPQPLSQVHQALERDRGGPDTSTVREHTDEFDAASMEPIAATGSVRGAPSPLDRPGIRVIETQLAPTGLAAEPCTVATPAAAASVFFNLIGAADREHFAVLLLDNRHRMTHAHIVSRGTGQSTLVHPREVFKAAVLANAAALIIGHNHPSGSVQPSPEDKAANDRIERAGELLGIRVLDSIIVGPSSTFHASSLGGTRVLPSSASAMSPAAERVAENELSTICRGLMRDIEEVLERQGEDWWDETVTSGTYHRQLAERSLGLAPYRPLSDAADPASPT